MNTMEQKLFEITHGALKDDDLKFVQDQWGLVATYIKDTVKSNAVVKEGELFYNVYGNEINLYVDPKTLDNYDELKDKKIWFLTEKQYQHLFLPF